MGDCKHLHLTKITNCGPTDYVCVECRLHFHVLPGLKPITVTFGASVELPTEKCAHGYSMSETCAQCARHYSESELPVSGDGDKS